MNDHKAEKIEPNDLKTSNDMRELELIAKYERLSDLVLTRLHGNFEIAEITPPIHMMNQGFDYGRFPFAAEMMISHVNDYEYDTAIEFSDRLEYLEKGSRDRWVQKNADKFANVEDAGDYYDKNWYLLTDVDYCKENLIRTSRGGKIQRDQRNAVYGNKKEYKDVFYTKPRAVLTVNGKEVDILPEKLREKIIVDARNP